MKKKWLITWCFDIIHLWHIRLFKFAKKHVDYLTVWLEHDETIRLTKGERRPIHDIDTRIEILKEIKSIDKILQLDNITDYKIDQQKSEEIYYKTLKQINPHILITTIESDKFRKSKKIIAEELWIIFIPFHEKQAISSSQLIQKIGL